MQRARKAKNPFYALLLVVGIAFVVTAFAYGVMYLQLTRAEPDKVLVDSHPLWSGLRAHGDATLVVELVLLATLTCAAIGTDDYWERRAAHAASRNSPEEDT